MHRAPADAIEPHPFSGAGRSCAAPRESAQPARKPSCCRTASQCCPPRRGAARILPPQQGAEGPGDWLSLGITLCWLRLCAETQAAAKQHHPRHHTPQQGAAGWGKAKWLWLQHDIGLSLRRIGFYLFIAIIRHPDH